MDKSKLFLWVVFLLVLEPIQATEKSSSSDEIVYSVDGLIESAIKKNFDIRANAEKIYRARKRIKVAIGHLVPNLNLGNFISALKPDYFDLVPTLIGFIFPSNWFGLKESKLFFQAEWRNYGAMIANEINAVETLAYQIHAIISLEQIFVTYLLKLGKIVEIVRMRTAAGEDSLDSLLTLENIELRMKHDVSVMRNTITNQLSELANAIALDTGKDWSRLRIAPINLPPLGEVDFLDADDIIDEIMKKSLERKAFIYLTLAAKYARYSRSFQFLSPYGDVDGSFGFGYAAYVNIGKSQEREVKIKQEELDSNLLKATIKAVSDHNVSLQLYTLSFAGFTNAYKWHDFLVAKLNEGGEYEPQQFIQSLQSLIGFHSRVYQAQHYYLISRAQIDRLLWNRIYYRELLDRIEPPSQAGRKNKELGSWLSRKIMSQKRKAEDKKIAKDIKANKIILPDK